MSVSISVIDPTQGNQAVPVGQYGGSLSQAKDKFIQENAAMGATPSKIKDEPGRTTIIYPQSQTLDRLLDKWDPTKKVARGDGDKAGAYQLQDDGAQTGKFTPTT